MKTPEQIADLLHAIAAHPEHTIEGALCVMADIIRQRDATHRELGAREERERIVRWLSERADAKKALNQGYAADTLIFALTLIEQGQHTRTVALDEL